MCPADASGALGAAAGGTEAAEASGRSESVECLVRPPPVQWIIDLW